MVLKFSREFSAMQEGGKLQSRYLILVTTPVSG